MERTALQNILLQPSSGQQSLTQFRVLVCERIRGHTTQYFYRLLLGSWALRLS